MKMTPSIGPGWARLGHTWPYHWTIARLGLQYVEDFKQRIPRSEAEQLIQLVSDAAEKAYGPKQAADRGWTSTCWRIWRFDGIGISWALKMDMGQFPINGGLNET